MCFVSGLASRIQHHDYAGHPGATMINYVAQTIQSHFSAVLTCQAAIIRAFKRCETFAVAGAMWHVTLSGPLAAAKNGDTC